MFSNPEYIKSMITYIIQEPDLTQSPKFFQKFPFNSSEIFFLELEDIINAFFVAKQEEAFENQEKFEKEVETIDKFEEESDNNEMMEKCTGILSKYDRMISLKKKQILKSIEELPIELNSEVEENQMERKIKNFKSIENHFDLFKNSSYQSISYPEGEGKFELLDHLFSFLGKNYDQEKLNLTFSGYFSKVVHALMNKRFMDVNFF